MIGKGFGKGFGKELLNKAQEVANSAMESAQNIKIPDKMSADEIKEKLKEKKMSADEIKEKLKEKKMSTDEIKEKLKEKKNQFIEEKNKQDENDISFDTVSISSCLKTLYYLMAVDGEISKEEELKFDELGHMLDTEYDTNKGEILSTCKAQINKVIDEDDYYDVIQDGIEDALLFSLNAKDMVISSKHLLWNMMIMAYADDEYSEAERRIIKYVCRKLNVEKDVFLEMESTLLTLRDIQKEIDWIKTTDRPYLTIERVVKELENRVEVISEAVSALVLL